MTHTSPLVPGLKGRASTQVVEALTAPVMGSGTVAVYATPAMVALMEAAAVACIEPHLAAGQASLGVRIDVEHVAATPPGLTVEATATLSAVDGRKLTFEIETRDSVDVIGRARHTRIIVDTARFLAKLHAKASAT